MRKYILLSLLITGSSVVAAQELTLFEEVESQEARQPARTAEARRATDPKFTLRGTSRFGDNIRVTLSADDDQSVSVQWREKASVGIEGYTGYQVIDVGSRSASIRYPAGTDCVPFPDQGVSCSSDGRIALLNLRNSSPIAVAPSPSTVDATDEVTFEEALAAGGEVVGEDGQVYLFNPFSGQPQLVPEISEEERQRRAERQANRAERLRDFQPVRIANDEVPDGMRVVRTPFGDRLVPENSDE